MTNRKIFKTKKRNNQKIKRTRKRNNLKTQKRGGMMMMPPPQTGMTTSPGVMPTISNWYNASARYNASTYQTEMMSNDVSRE